MKLYVYDHCPYCTRARMIFGYKNIELDLHYILNDDVDAHLEKIGSKIVPILQKPDGTYMSESLDIVRYLDHLDQQPILDENKNESIHEWIAEHRLLVNKLAMPRWAWSDMPEFKTAGARAYFTVKKEQAIGAFGEHFSKSDDYIAQINKALQDLDELLEYPHYVHNAPSYDDIILFAQLRSLTMVKSIIWPEKLRQYLIYQSEISKVWLFDAYAM